MFEKSKLFLYPFDLIGTTPRLFIFNNDRYKTILTSLLSIIIFLFALAFTLFSLVQYFNYDNPIVFYSKSSDDKSKREIFLKDTFLMFQLIETSSANIINDSIAYFEGNYRNIYDDGNIEDGTVFIEKCEFGININWEYFSIIKPKLNFARPIETFYCISAKNGNISLFYKPNIGYSNINLDIIIKNNSYYIPERIQPLVIFENSLIDHINKSSPLNKNFIYHQTASFNSLEFTNIDYEIQFIKYESDDGFFGKNNKIFSGIAFNNMVPYRRKMEDYDLNKNLEKTNISKIGTITFRINQSSFDYYKRNYQKLQSLLAEIMSVINLLFEVGKQISFFMCDKKMSKNIIKAILDKENLINKKNYKKNILNFKRYEEEKKLSSERNKMNIKLIDKKNNTDISESNHHFKLDISKDNNNFSRNEIKKSRITNNKVFKKMNYFHILKSYFCFKDKKTNLINLCHSIIIHDLCVEKILERAYNFEKIYHFLTSKEKVKTENFENKRIKEIKKYIYEISNEIKRENSIKKEQTN